MDPAQLAHEACKRFEQLQTRQVQAAQLQTAQLQAAQVQTAQVQTAQVQTAGANASTSTPGPGGEPILDVFRQLGTLDGWAKVAMDRLAGDSQDARAGQELRRSVEQTARLHPSFARRLTDVLADRPAVKTSRTTTLPTQPTSSATLNHTTP